MKKYVSSLLRTACIMIVMFNIYIFSSALVKTADEETSKTDKIAYVYDIPQTYKLDEENNKDISSYPAIETFVGNITGYGPDCYGCTGSGNTASGYNIKNTMYYQDTTYGQLRILAADRSIPIGTIIRVSGLKVYDVPFLAIVLDRGGAITGTHMDLAFTTEKDPLVSQIGNSKNITYEVLKYGTGKI